MSLSNSAMRSVELSDPEIAWNIERETCERSLHRFLIDCFPLIDPEKFCDGRHIEIMCERLEAVARGEITRLLINVPPRTSKSMTVNVVFPAWVWAQQPMLEKVEPLPLSGPHVRFISASYDGQLSMRDNVRMRNIIRSPWYQNFWGHRYQIVSDQDVKTRFANTAGGFRQSTSVQGLATGEGADVLLIDDPHNVRMAESATVREDTVRWFREVLPTRLNDREHSAVIVVMQRVHEGDVSGYILSRELGYDHVCLPALYEIDHPFRCRYDWRAMDGEPLWPERSGFDRDGIAQLGKELGSYATACQLQQRPAPRGGGMFKESWFRTVTQAPPAVARCRGWDLAASESVIYMTDVPYTASVLVSRDANGIFYIEDVQRFRGSAERVERELVNQARIDGRRTKVRIPQDPGQAGKAQSQYLIRQLAGYNAIAVRPTGAKEVRAMPMAAQAEAGNICVVKAPWNADFFDELSVFPSGRFTDMVDAAADAFNELAKPTQQHGILHMSWAAKPRGM